MNDAHNPSKEEIFAEALRLPAPEGRAAYLKQACGNDEPLRRRVEALLHDHENAGEFLDRPLVALSARTLAITTGMIPLTEKPGDKIGRYKLREQIGEGGCGVVYVAEQEEPVRRRVALKVIKLGMDTKQVVARFEAERQALALMDHPNIAKVLDAGATDTGRPYFVMELVRGIKITDYCDQNNLSTGERLKLYIQVCHAIQHAHQKGIIHRDIKPSNILVTLHDGVPVPKVIDFGIAKATTDQRLTDKTIYTAFEQFIGTPAYMSPEQAEMSGLDIDTRSDIYSLGVLLYELLTGETPFNSKTLLQAGLDQMRRIIREQEPPRPSTRLSTLNHADLAAIAKRRHAEPPKLISSIRGDLDWIAMKCLEKDRTRRFEAVSALAMDVKRHLDNEIVVARPPSQLYRLQKLIKRNRSVLVVSAAVIAMVAVVLVVLIALLHKEEKARQRAIAAEKRRTQLSQETEPRRLDEQARALEGEGKLAEAEDSYRKLLAIQTNLFGRVNSNVANTLDNLAGVLARRQKLVEAEAAYRDLLIMRPDTLSPVENLAEVLVLQHRYAEADDLFSPLLGPGNKNQAQIGAILSARANFRARTARWREATVDMSRAVELAPNDHYNWYQLAPLLIESGDFAAYAKHRQTMLTQYGTTKDACIAERTAKACLLLPVTGQVLTIASELADTAVTVGHQDPWLAYFQFAKGLAEYRQGHFANAVEWTQQALKEPGVEYRDAQANAVLAMAYYQLKRPDVARDTLAEALDIIKPVLAKIENRDLDAAWHDWVMAQILLREARSLIENKPGAPEQPR